MSYFDPSRIAVQVRKAHGVRLNKLLGREHSQERKDRARLIRWAKVYWPEALKK